jgi:hypothetical protein
MSVDERKIAVEVDQIKKPKKYARSEAELIALKQRRIQIVLTAANVCASVLTLLKVFGIL